MTVVQFQGKAKQQEEDAGGRSGCIVNDADCNKVLVETAVVWLCACGYPLFFVTKTGIVCQACGKTQNWDNDK